MDVFFQQVEDELEEIRKDLKNARPLEMTKEDWDRYNAAVGCWVCDGPFKPYKGGDCNGLWKVKDHCHITGEYRGAAHLKCNQQLRIDPFRTPIPVFFHNLKNYDSHHLISAVGRTEEKTTTFTNKDDEPLMIKDSERKDKPRKVTDGKLSGICQNMEKLISFSWGQVRFVDSYAFLSSSLDRLVINTPKEDLTITQLRFGGSSGNKLKFDLKTRKGAYPYEYMTDFARFEETELRNR